jgi:hypothetical protein
VLEERGMDLGDIASGRIRFLALRKARQFALTERRAYDVR